MKESKIQLKIKESVRVSLITLKEQTEEKKYGRKINLMKAKIQGR